MYKHGAKNDLYPRTLLLKTWIQAQKWKNKQLNNNCWLDHVAVYSAHDISSYKCTDTSCIVALAHNRMRALDRKDT